MQSLTSFVRVIVVFGAGVLVIAAALLIFNTIRMAMFARRREIEVMKLVGATNWFIRVPFMVEGLVQGLLGSALAVGSIYLLNSLFTNQVNEGSIPFFEGFVVSSNDVFGVCVGLGIAGVAIGVIFSGIAASLYVDV